MEKNNNEIEIKVPEIDVQVPKIEIEIPKIKKEEMNISKIAWYLCLIPLAIQVILYFTEI